MAYLIAIPVGYLLGSVPFGLIISRVFRGVDLREYGSGKTGTTNVLRTVGVRGAAAVLVLDMGKAVLGVAIVRLVFDSPGAEAAAAMAALVGHNWPVFSGFRGGRGTAPGWGGLYILSPLSGVAATVIGVPVLALSRYASLGSLLGAVSGVITMAVLAAVGWVAPEYLWFGGLGLALIVARHRDNIGRLARGEERKIGQSANPVGHDRDVARGPKPERRRGLRWPRSA